MISRTYGKSGPWFLVPVHYPSALMAKRAWERADRKLSGRGLDIGLVRLSSRQANLGNAIPSGAPDDVHPVVAVSLNESAAKRAERLLGDGTSWEPHDDFCQALVARRARVVLENPGPGRIRMRRPESRGAQLDELGGLHEPPPGKG